MTLKSLLTTIEKTVLISNFGIVSRLRCVICILIFSICILLGQNSSYAQGLELKVVPDLYFSADLSKVIRPGQAFILFNYSPTGTVTDTTIWTYQDIKSGKAAINWSYYSGSGSFGRIHSSSSQDIASILGIIDSNFYYVRSLNSSFLRIGINSLNDQLASVGLGSPSSRATYISSLNSSFDIDPVNFASNLGPWIVVGIVLFIAIPPLWWVVRRFLR